MINGIKLDREGFVSAGDIWLGRRDSNPDTQLQRLQSYR
jgi:hypothetical protein